MSIVVNIVGLASTIFTIAYGILVPNVAKERNYYKSIFEENTIKKTYFNYLNNILDFITDHFGKSFSGQSLSLNTNLAVFYSFAVFFFIYIFTGYGSFGNLAVLNGNISKSMRFFILLVSTLYFLFLYSNYKNIRTNLSKKILFSRKVLLVSLSLFPSILIALIISFEWNGIHDVSIDIKTLAIVSLAITLSAAILGFSGDGKGSKRGYGALVFNVTYLSMVGLAAVFSSFIQIQENAIKPFVILAVFISLCIITYVLWKKKKGIYFYNVFIVGLSIYVKNFIPNIFGMDIISSSLIYFFVALPFINGLLDYISLSISRLFAKKNRSGGESSNTYYTCNH